MKRYLFACLFALLYGTSTKAQVQYTTESPRVDDINYQAVAIKRVELTEQYTIVYMKFLAPGDRSPNRSQPFSFPMPNGGQREWLESSSNIGFEPTSRLYVNEGERSYKFIKAENIPAEMRMRVSPGKRVDFVVYFERIDPGYTTFDLFECKDNRNTICFNFWGVHIINPQRRNPNALQKPRTPATPKPQLPKYVPRTTPGLGTPEPPAKPQTKPEPAPTVVAINGVTRDTKTKQPVVATITYQLLSGKQSTSGQPADSVESANPTGAYKITVNQRGVYAVTASAKGYFSQSDTLATNRVDVTRDFNLVPIEAGAKITLKNIYFNASQYDLQPESFPELDRLATIMQTNPTMNIRLEGHTDIVGDFDANVDLSRSRVNEVKRYLVKKGISASRIDAVGYGASRPLNTNRSVKERPENRRVEMVIVKV